MNFQKNKKKLNLLNNFFFLIFIFIFLINNYSNNVFASSKSLKKTELELKEKIEEYIKQKDYQKAFEIQTNLVEIQTNLVNHLSKIIKKKKNY
ncbi:hypothetical protein [Candidatus Phytoplasma oryzae]|nr:hypothetical protein PIE28_01855 [Candidatus Phytoplasma oryzae]